MLQLDLVNLVVETAAMSSPKTKRKNLQERLLICHVEKAAIDYN